jgi:hypothetical protein
MPFKDPEARAAYIRDYMRNYYADKPKQAKKARKLKAAWESSHTQERTTRKRRQRRAAATAERLGLAMQILSTHPNA